MIARGKVYRALVVGCMSLSGIACAGSAVYVGVAVPGPWYGGYPYPVGRVGVYGRPPRVCCYDGDGPASETPGTQTIRPLAADSTADSTGWALRRRDWPVAGDQLSVIRDQ